MEDLARTKAAVKGHSDVFLHSIGNSSGRYKFVCVDCKQSLNYHEGEWFGYLMSYDCPRKITKAE